MLNSFGVINYDPRNIKTKYRDWWMILNCDEELSKYYRYWILKELGVKTMKSGWGTHISVCRGEEPIHKDLWLKYQGLKVEFEYNPESLNTNGKHWWFRIYSKNLEYIRKELGLISQPTYIDNLDKKLKINPFHLTVGHIVIK